MPYIDRTSGVVTGLYANPQVPDHEFLAEDDSEVLAYRARRARKRRRLFNIWQDINALSGGQQTSIWADITSGSPPKWTQDEGPNGAAIMVLHWSATASGATAGNLNDARRRLVSMYVQDNPAYLVNPVFDPTINVPGDEPG